jgi:hypothetical protein
MIDGIQKEEGMISHQVAFQAFSSALKDRGFTVYGAMGPRDNQIEGYPKASLENVSKLLANADRMLSNKKPGDPPRRFLFYVNGDANDENHSTSKDAHDVGLSNNKVLNLDVLAKVLDHCERAGDICSVSDLSCYSGLTLKLKDRLRKTCIMSATVPGGQSTSLLNVFDGHGTMFEALLGKVLSEDTSIRNMQDLFLKARYPDTESFDVPQLSSLRTPIYNSVNALATSDPSSLNRNARISASSLCSDCPSFSFLAILADDMAEISAKGDLLLTRYANRYNSDLKIYQVAFQNIEAHINDHSSELRAAVDGGYISKKTSNAVVDQYIQYENILRGVGSDLIYDERRLYNRFQELDPALDDNCSRFSLTK